MRAHVIGEDGRIANTVVVAGLDALPGLVLIDADLHPGNVGDEWDGGKVIPPAPQPFYRSGAAKRIDEAVAAIYTRFGRFQVEYADREAQALAFKGGGYAGPVPVRVADFATPAGMAPAAATDLILSQAAALRAALDQLSALRMRKYEVLRAATDAAAETTAGQILAAVAAIGAQVA